MKLETLIKDIIDIDRKLDEDCEMIDLCEESGEDGSEYSDRYEKHMRTLNLLRSELTRTVVEVYTGCKLTM